MPFKARIYKVGINAVVEVPLTITSGMKPVKGYIAVTGKINGHEFNQTLVPIKDAPYRLYVNIPMLEGGHASIGDVASFELKQDFSDQSTHYPMVPALKKALASNKLTKQFNELTAARRKDILKYLNGIKTEETMMKHVKNIIAQLKKSVTNVRVP